MKYAKQESAETGKPSGYGAFSYAPLREAMERRKKNAPGSGFKRFINMMDNNFRLLVGLALGIAALIMGWWIIFGQGPNGIRLFERPQQESEQTPQKSESLSDQAIRQTEDQLTGLVDRVNTLTDSISHLESKLIRAHVLADSIITAEQRVSSPAPEQPAVSQAARRVGALPPADAGQAAGSSNPAESHRAPATRIAAAPRQSTESAAENATTAGEQISKPRGNSSAASAALSPGTTTATVSRTKPDHMPEGRTAAVTATEVPATRENPAIHSLQEQWVVNLSSLPSQADADRFAAVARSRGIETQQQQVTVNGKEYWRIQTIGFPTATEAQTYAGIVRQKLDLTNVWITRR